MEELRYTVSPLVNQTLKGTDRPTPIVGMTCPDGSISSKLGGCVSLGSADGWDSVDISGSGSESLGKPVDTVGEGSNDSITHDRCRQYTVGIRYSSDMTMTISASAIHTRFDH